MKDGFIRVAAISPDLRVADVAYNTEKIIEAVKFAAADGVKVLCLPELAITGYTCGDLFGSKLLIDAAKDALIEIVKATADLPIFFAVGLPYMRNGKLYNVAAAVCGGEVLGLVPKTNIPSYGEFYERRNFTPANIKEQDYLYEEEPIEQCAFGASQIFVCNDMPELKIGIEICEDAWVTIPPSSELAQNGATLILNLSASDEIIGKADYRRQLISSQSAKIVGGYVYADAGCGESTTDLVFSGHNLIAENGTILAESKPFGKGYAVSEIDLQRIVAERARMTTFERRADCEWSFATEFSLDLVDTTLTRPIARRPFVPDDEATLRERCEAIVMMQAQGLARRVKHIGCKCVIGISGGLDSTLALLVTARAFDLLGRDRKDIITITMPGFGTTSRTKSNAELLCDSLGVTFRTIPIGDAVRQHFADIGHDPSVTDVTYENSQARERTQILMDVANQVGGIVVGTGDLSELALGWATYNGDHMAMYGVNASIPKTLVRHLVAYFALIADDETQKKVLLDILDTPVSPELLPAKDGEIAQKTEDLVGPYDLHDFYLYYMLRFGFTPRKIFRLAKIAWGDTYDDATILKWLKIFLRRFFTQQFKRSCLPDGPKVGTVTLSPRGDWRMPSDASAALWLAEVEKLEREVL